MNKEKIIELLDLHRDRYYSGEEIAKYLNITRTAVWKTIKNLRSEGYKIDAVPNKGYCLSGCTDVVSESGVRRFLDPEYSFCDIHAYKSLVSTNTALRKEAESGKKEGTVIIAQTQTGGKGRMGRSFYSPSSGLYMSILLRPQGFDPAKTAGVTTTAAVAACEAIEEVTSQVPQIKWVNDIYLRSKKVCGILTEASMGLENGSVEYIVLGIGFNVLPPEEGFPPEIENIAGAILTKPQNDCKNRLAASFIGRFFDRYLHPRSDRLEDYRRRCFVLGKEICVVRAGKTTAATAIAIDDECHLVVRYANGATEALSSGEISIRPVAGGHAK